MSRSVIWSRLAFLLAKLPPTIVLWIKTSTHQSTRHRIYADSSQPTPNTSLSNADCKLATTADSTFESALIGGIRPTVDVNFSTHLPTAVGRLSLRRQVGRCVLKIGRCVLKIGRCVLSIRGPRFEPCVAVLQIVHIVFTLHCPSSLRCIHEYLVIDNGWCLTNNLRALIAAWLDASQRSWDGVCLNRSAREVKCKVLWAIQNWLQRYARTYLLPLAWGLPT